MTTVSIILLGLVLSPAVVVLIFSVIPDKKTDPSIDGKS